MTPAADARRAAIRALVELVSDDPALETIARAAATAVATIAVQGTLTAGHAWLVDRRGRERTHARFGGSAMQIGTDIREWASLHVRPLETLVTVRPVLRSDGDRSCEAVTVHVERFGERVRAWIADVVACHVSEWHACAVATPHVDHPRRAN